MASAATPACLSAWATSLAARVGTEGLTGPVVAAEVRLARADQAVEATAGTPLLRVRLTRPMLGSVRPGALSDWLLRLAEENPSVGAWQVVLHPQDITPGVR